MTNGVLRAVNLSSTCTQAMNQEILIPSYKNGQIADFNFGRYVIRLIYNMAGLPICRMYVVYPGYDLVPNELKQKLEMVHLQLNDARVAFKVLDSDKGWMMEGRWVYDVECIISVLALLVSVKNNLTSANRNSPVLTFGTKDSTLAQILGSYVTEYQGALDHDFAKLLDSIKEGVLV